MQRGLFLAVFGLNMIGNMGVNMANSLEMQNNQIQHEARTSPEYEAFLNAQLENSSLREAIKLIFPKDEPVKEEDKST
jgi:hypothetical protein